MKSKIYKLLVIVALCNVYMLLKKVALSRCNNDNTIKNNFLKDSNEYWTCYSTISSDYTYYQFSKDNLSHRFSLDNKNGLYEDKGSCHTSEVTKKWFVSKDSIMIWGGLIYDVVSYNKNVVVLNFRRKEKPFTGYIFLIKQKKKLALPTKLVYKKLDHLFTLSGPN